MSVNQTFDVAVVGAGVFGAWTAYQLRRAGSEVVLIDAYGPGNSRASSGGESRIIRLGYGPDEIYTRSAQRSLAAWQEFFDLIDPVGAKHNSRGPLFRRTGVLWLAHELDAYCEATFTTLQRVGVKCEKLERTELCQCYPQLNFGSVSWGLLEPDAGALMARQAVQAVVAQARADGVTYLEEVVIPTLVDGKLGSITTGSGKEICADIFIFACGPWLPKLFPEVVGAFIHITRQEVFFFGVPPGNDSFAPERLPAWVDFSDLVYGIPNLDGRGFKIAIDAHGPSFDPDTDERVVSAAGLTAVRAYLEQRVPQLADAPVVESRVCQYENTSNGDFLIDRHPACENVWLVGGGSGHGFKHGPAVGQYVTGLISGLGKTEPRFTLATKGRTQQRMVY